MSNAPISDEVALRIGLAARVLPDMEVGLLLNILTRMCGQPITSAKLTKVRVNRFRAVASDELQNASDEDIKNAINLLKGRGFSMEKTPLPEIESFAEGEMPGSIRVACSVESGENIDAHFGSCPVFLIYQVAPDEIRLVDIRTPEKAGPDEDKNAIRAALISDCHVLCTKSIGGPAAAKVVRAGLHPIKVPQGGEARDFLTKLQSVLKGSPPPWLAKVMGETPEQRIRFQQEAAQ